MLFVELAELAVDFFVDLLPGCLGDLVAEEGAASECSIFSGVASVDNLVGALQVGNGDIGRYRRPYRPAQRPNYL